MFVDPSIVAAPPEGTPHRRLFLLGALGVLGLALLLAAAPVAIAEPEEHPDCPASSLEQARTLGDELFEQGAYRRAGNCYQAAREFDLANRAFLKAVEPESAATARQLSDQRDHAKMMWRTVERAFRTEH
jgi:hypothetical protein